MKPLNTMELLQVWDESNGMSLLEKTLFLLSRACDINDWKEIGKLSIGERDARLLTLREWMFGTRLKNMIKCPVCNETIEWEINSEDFHLQPVKQELAIETFYLQQNQLNIHFRLPDSYDVLKFVKQKNEEPAVHELIGECILDITGSNNKNYSTEVLGAAEWEALEQSMSKQDPQADINMQITCPNCNHRWEAAFDIMSFLWSEINNWAKQIMNDVALLAHAFKWSEKDILNMSPLRRQLYIEMLYK